MTNQEMFKQEFIALLVKYNIEVDVQEKVKGWYTEVTGINFYSINKDIDFTLDSYTHWRNLCGK